LTPALRPAAARPVDASIESGAAASSPTGGAQTGWMLLALISVAALFQLITIRAGHDWGDDFALYILHARSLLEGRAYADTGFIYSDANRWYSPEVYPPGFPLLLLPVYALFGLDLVAMKVLVWAFFAGAIALCARVFRPVLRAPYLLLLVALVGFQPYLTDFKNQVLPDLPFVFFVLLNLLLLGRLLERPPAGWRAVVWGLAGAFTLYFAVALRSVGIALYGGVVLALLFRRKLPGIALTIAVGGSLLLWAVQRLLIGAFANYSAQIAGYATQVTRAGGSLWDLLPGIGKLRVLAAHSYELWAGLPFAVGVGITIAILALGMIGLFSRLRRFTILEGFTISYYGILFLYPLQLDDRYLVPLFPFMVFYGCVGAALLVGWLGRPAAVAAAALALLVAAAFTARLARADYGPIRLATSTAATELYSAVQACTSPGERIMFSKIRALILFTGRSGLATPRPNVDLGQFLKDAQIRHVAVWRNDRVDVQARDPSFQLSPVFQNRTFVLYRNDAGPSGFRAPPPQCAQLRTGG
jgi:hypothetical protein